MLEVRVNAAGLEAKLKELDFALQRKTLLQAAKKGAAILLRAIKSGAPGDLGEKFQTRTLSESDLNEATVRVEPTKKGFHAKWVEKGTKERFRKKKHNAPTGRMPARPFVGPAVDAVEDEMQRAMTAELTAHLQGEKNG